MSNLIKKEVLKRIQFSPKNHYSALNYQQEINELKQELARKEALIARHHEKLIHWQGLLSRPHGSQPAQQTAQQPAQSQQQAAGQQSGAAGSAGAAAAGGSGQGPLAYLEQTTSSIGLPGR